jgi:hypothetical protein
VPIITSGIECGGCRRDAGEHPEIGDDREVEPSVVTEDPDAVEEGGVEPAEDVVLERDLRDRVADHHPEHRDDEDAPEVHHQHVEDVPAAVHPSVEKRESRCHEQHECCRHQDPGDVAFHLAPLLAARGRGRRLRQHGLAAMFRPCVLGGTTP